MSLRSTVFDPSYKNLSGVHKVQRVPTTEKNQRRHSSEVVIVWLGDNSVESQISELDEADIKEEFIRTSGPGGQHKNKVSSSVRLTHTPSGVSVVADGERRQSQNRAVARERLTRMVQGSLLEELKSNAASSKQSQFDNDRLWTWVEWRDEVKAPNGSRASYKNCLKGKFGKLVK